MGKAVNRRQFSASLSPELIEALHRLRRASGTPISKLMEAFLNVEVLDSISEGLEMAKDGKGFNDVASHMSSIVGRHIVAASESLKDFQRMGEK